MGILRGSIDGTFFCRQRNKPFRGWGLTELLWIEHSFDLLHISPNQACAASQAHQPAVMPREVALSPQQFRCSHPTLGRKDLS